MLVLCLSSLSLPLYFCLKWKEHSSGYSALGIPLPPKASFHPNGNTHLWTYKNRRSYYSPFPSLGLKANRGNLSTTLYRNLRSSKDVPVSRSFADFRQCHLHTTWDATATDFHKCSSSSVPETAQRKVNFTSNVITQLTVLWRSESPKHNLINKQLMLFLTLRTSQFIVSLLNGHSGQQL